MNGHFLTGYFFADASEVFTKAVTSHWARYRKNSKSKILKSKNSTSHVRENVNFDMIRENSSFIRGSEIGFRLHMSQGRFLIFSENFSCSFSIFNGGSNSFNSFCSVQN